MSKFAGIAINHKTGMLYLEVPASKGEIIEKPRAAFTEMKESRDPIKFLPFIAKALARKCRFAGQLSDSAPSQWSILHHSLACGEFAFVDKRSDDEQLFCLMHDIGEAFYVDVPSPFKTLENERIEAAIVRAMPYPWIRGFIEGTHSGGDVNFHYVHEVDKISGVVEAKVMGNNWYWPKHAVKSYPRKAITTMKHIVENTGAMTTEEVISDWTHWTTQLLKRCGHDKVPKDA